MVLAQVTEQPHVMVDAPWPDHCQDCGAPQSRPLVCVACNYVVCAKCPPLSRCYCCGEEIPHGKSREIDLWKNRERCTKCLNCPDGACDNVGRPTTIPAK